MKFAKEVKIKTKHSGIIIKENQDLNFFQKNHSD